jgi:penicillin-binding protein 1A
MVGGYEFTASEFNRATQARRQPGSAFKPIIYAAALEKGKTSASILYDRPVVYDDPTSGFTWRPENYGRRFLGPLTMSEALARSVNNATIHLLRDIGVGRVIRYARRLGIESPLEPNLSLALGSSPVSLLELTRAYGIFASGGRSIHPRFIRRVLDREGEVLLQSVLLEGPAPEASEETPETGTAEIAAVAVGAEREEAGLDEAVLSPVEAFLATDLLRSVVTHPRGTGRRARSLGKPVAGKTGTTNEQGDAWFMGFSPDVVTGVWVGYDEKRVLGPGETGGRAALPIWLDFMKVALAARPAREFQVPEGIVFVRIDGKTGLLASASSESARFQAFAVDTVPGAGTSGYESDPANDRGRRVRLDF